MIKNSITKAQTRTSLAAYLTNDAVKAQISKVVGGKGGDRFISSLLSAVQANPALQECSNSSLVSAAMLGQALNLSPSPQLGQYYMVPYLDNKMHRKVAQFTLGYKGMIQLALRSGQYKKLNVLAIKEGELVKYDPLEEEIEVNLIEDEAEREAAPTAGYYAYFEYLNGFRKTLYWSKAKMEAHAEHYSKGYASHKGYTFWERDFDAMAYKTMLRQLISKWGIMSIDMVTAIDADGGVVGSDGTVDYVETAEEPIAEAPGDPEQTEEPKTEHKEEAIFG